MRVTLVVFFLVLLGVSAEAQQTSLKVDVRAAAGPVPDADVVVNGVTYHTGADGSVVIPVGPGRVEIVVVKTGFAAVQASVDVQPNQQQPVVVELARDVSVEEHVTVSATDEKGNTQPDLSQQKWNQQGYIFAAPVPHPVKVSG